MRMRDAYARDLPEEQQIWDYGARTDGQPDYYAHANINLATSAHGWTIMRFTYNGSNFVLTTKCKVGIWDLRATLLP